MLQIFRGVSNTDFTSSPYNPTTIFRRMLQQARHAVVLLAACCTTASAFRPPQSFVRSGLVSAARCNLRPLGVCGVHKLRMQEEKPNNSVDYNNKVIEAFGGMLKSTDLEQISWSTPKREGLSLAEMASSLDAGLREREWFVTGNIMPELFSDAFKFQDPDVKLEGVENYARGVNKLFDSSSRAEIVDCSVNDAKANTITVTWRLSGKVKLGPGVTIKPYIVYTDLVTDPSTGLVVFQEDRFSIPGWDLLLSSFVPFLRPFLTPPAPPIEELEKQFAETGSV